MTWNTLYVRLETSYDLAGSSITSNVNRIISVFFIINDGTQSNALNGLAGYFMQNELMNV